MSRARKAGVVSTYDRLHPVERPLAYVVTLYIVAGDLQNAPVHGQVVMPSGDDQVHPLDDPVSVYTVVVEQGAPRRFRHTDPLPPVDGRMRPHVLAQDVRIRKQLVKNVDTVDYLDKASPVIVKGAVRVAAKTSTVLSQFAVRGRCPQLVDDVEACEGPTR